MKLSGLTIVVIFLCVGLCALCYTYFQVYAPNEIAKGQMDTYRGQLETEAAKQKKADERVQKAIAKVNQAAQDWNTYVATKTPADSLAMGGINVFENQYQLVVDSRKYRNSAQRAFNAQLHVGGVKIVSAPEIPAPTDSEKDILVSYYNYPAFNFPVVLWELGTVTVQGNYNQIMKNYESWSNMPHYLAVADGLRVDGTSPVLTGTYNVTIVGFIHASKVFPPPSATLASASTPGSAPSTPKRGQLR